MTKLITELRKHTSTLDKQCILHSETTEEEKKMFKWAYDPFKTYKLKFQEVCMDMLGEVREEMFDILNNLASGRLSGNSARTVVESYAKQHGDLIKLICNKDLSCGVSATTLNKVFGDSFIPKFAIQLAREVDINKIKLPIWGQIKYNGARVIAIVEKGLVTFKSGGGHEFSFPELSDTILNKFNHNFESFILDGELTFGDSKNEDHTKVSGLVNSSIKGTPIKSNLGLVYNIFDIMTTSEFEGKKCNHLYFNRFATVKRVVEILDSPIIQFAKTYNFTSTIDIESLYADMLYNGYEGLILKAPDSEYTFKKNATWIKMKATDTADLLCTGYNEGEIGKYEGLIGSLICEGIIDGKHIKVNVGSGLNDSDRNTDPQKFIGKIIEVHYNKVIQDSKTKEWSLFLPRFIIVREDKS